MKNQAELNLTIPDAAFVHSDGFHFFNINIHRTMILIEFDDDEASVVWVGTHQEYETTLKNYPSVSPEMFRRIKNSGINLKGIWPDKRPMFSVYPSMNHKNHAASEHPAIWVDLSL